MRSIRLRLPWMAFLLALLPREFILAQQTTELQGGRWVEVAQPTTQPQTIDPALLRIEELLQSGRSNEAMKQCVAWLKANKTSPLYDRGLFLMSEGLYQYGDRVKAFYYLDQLLDEYPDSPLYAQALEKQFVIADGFLNGYKRRLLKMPLLGGEEEAVEMLFRIQQRSPRSLIAEKSLLRTANYYYADGQYDLAGDAYAAYTKSYPKSPETPQVKLKQAYSYLAQFRGLRFDAAPVVDAQTQLQAIQTEYPEMAAQVGVPDVLERIQTTFARKAYVTADFYRRTHKPQAAAYLYEYLIKNYPNSPEADRARTALVALGTTGSPGAAPTTQP